MSSVSGAGSRPAKPPVVQPGSGNAIIINPCQRLNPLLDCVRNVSKEFGDIIPDFQLGRTTCALYLSLRYHRLHPEYIHQRIQRLGNLFTLRLLILMCDVSEHQEPIRELTKICLINNITIIVCWSNEEAGMYLATYKLFEHRPPDLIKERVDKEYNAMLRSALTSINKVNKTDVETLRTSFGSFAKIAHATPEELRRLPGFGQVKVRRILEAFDKPFRNKATSALPEITQPQVQLESQSSAQNNSVVETSQWEEGESDIPELGRSDEETQNGERIAAEIHDSQTQSHSQLSNSSSTPTSSRIHKFGSAADMPTPPPPTSTHALTPNRASGSSRQVRRERSPIWDIELDLNEDEISGTRVPEEVQIDTRLAKKEKGNLPIPDEKGQQSDVDYVAEEQQQRMEKSRRQRSPSPVWDIELDLNDDD